MNVNFRRLLEIDRIKKSVVWEASTSGGTREKTMDRSGNWGNRISKSPVLGDHDRRMLRSRNLKIEITHPFAVR